MSNARIMVVEDEVVVAFDIERRLTTLGYAVVGSTDRAEAAPGLVETLKPDLVLMDIRLKGPMDGATAAAEIRRRFGTPVIFLTAFAEEPTIERAKLSEPFGYILKPFNERELSSNIEIALYKHRAETEKQRLQEQLLKARELEVVGQLAGGIAHDFNNLLTAMILNLSFLRETACLGEESRQQITELEQGAQRAARLTRQLLQFSRREILQAKVVDLAEVLTTCVRNLGPVLGPTVQLSFQTRGGPAQLKADPALIEQMLANLCLNARDAMPRGGALTLSLQPQAVDAAHVQRNPEARVGRFLCLALADTGCGMDAATLRRAFEPFFTTKEVGQGSGLGLAAVYGIAKQHHGWVEAESTVGTGSTFRIFLPVLPGESEACPTAPPTPPPRGQATILVVDDDPGVRLAASAFLRRQGYTVLQAADGAEALRQWDLHREQVDLLFTDMVMPETMTGLELAQRFRQEKPSLKVVLCSGYSADLLQLGDPFPRDFRFLAKPWPPTELAQLMRDCLASKT